HDIDEDLYQKLAALGFGPVGVYWEKVKIHRTFQEFVFARPGEPGFAMLYPNHQIMPRRATFLTVFTSGAVVFTKNYQGGLEAEVDDFLAGVPGKPPVPLVDCQPKDQQPPAFLSLFHLAATVVGLLFAVGGFRYHWSIGILVGLGTIVALVVSKTIQGPQETPAPVEDP